ncbi:hypothetical protein O181_040425 [Austropuccinia psidii MF-1]|uniref:Uncharacterized protein n=1 Tax=Austropuccinia psidii MF-1 TaxID=1389203 RepID=A0A9Q3HG47_9BASI|nr:hypothetical protein [Austropuccinia psidii MF-1]
MAQTPENSTEFNELQTSAPESGSEISDMVSSHDLGIEVESEAHEINLDPPVLPESQPPSSQKTNFKSYEKEKTVEPCAPTEDAGQDDVIFSGEVEIISKEQFVSNIAQTIPRLQKIQNDSRTPDYATDTKELFNDNILNLKLMKESGKPPDNLPKSEQFFFKMVKSLLYSSNLIKHFWANIMFESISSVSYNVIAPKQYVAPTTSSTDPLGREWGVVENLPSCLSKSKQCATQLRIVGGRADNDILTDRHKNLEDLMDTAIHLIIP